MNPKFKLDDEVKIAVLYQCQGLKKKFIEVGKISCICLDNGNFEPIYKVQIRNYDGNEILYRSEEIPESVLLNQNDPFFQLEELK